MRAGNHIYTKAEDFPQIIPIFPLTGALLLPGGQLPLNIFEPRYLAMVDDAIAGDRLIGMIQPSLSGASDKEKPDLCTVGCIGRLTALQESNDGRYGINLSGICRFNVVEEVETVNGYRRCRIEPMIDDLGEGKDETAVDRDALLSTFRNYLDANNMEADWESIDNAGNETLVTALCMMSPYGPAEKQALLEAPDLKSRAETLIALTEMHLQSSANDNKQTLQ